VSETTEDRFLGGKLILRQPRDGFRAGLDAVMLAAAVPVHAGEAVLELGAGVGTASLCLARRVADCAIACVEIDPATAALARENVLHNSLADRVTVVEGDALGTALRGDYHHVFANPPFHGENGQRSPNEGRERAKRDEHGLAAWVDAALKRTRSRGTLTVIFRADRLAEVLSAAPETGVAVFPLWPRQGEAAKRVIAQIVKGSSAPLNVLPGLVLHESNGRYTREADAVLTGEGGIDMR
jgi:tRNA1(Val) A37 N6-methylase TrmN6